MSYDYRPDVLKTYQELERKQLEKISRIKPEPSTGDRPRRTAETELKRIRAWIREMEASIAKSKSHATQIITPT